MKNGALQYIHEQFKSIRINFIRSDTFKNTDFIHDYRVALKRIRAITKFVAKIPGSKDLRNLYRISYLENIYSAGGKLREVHINKQLLQEFEDTNYARYKGFKYYLKKKWWWAYLSLKDVRYLYSYRRIKNYEDKLLTVTESIPEDKLIKHIDQFIQNKIKGIELLVADHNVESKLHKIRKYIKSIKYLFEMIQISNREYGNLHFEIDKITILEDTIGDWHDYYEFKAELQEYIRVFGEVDKLAFTLKKIVDKEYSLKYKEAVQAVYKSFNIESK